MKDLQGKENLFLSAISNYKLRFIKCFTTPIVCDIRGVAQQRKCIQPICSYYTRDIDLHPRTRADRSEALEGCTGRRGLVVVIDPRFCPVVVIRSVQGASTHRTWVSDIQPQFHRLYGSGNSGYRKAQV